MENLVKFWQGKKVLVTGHTGFKGGWLSLWLQHLGAEVIGFAQDPICSDCFFSQAQVGQGIIDIRGDLAQFDLLQSTIEKFQPEIVFHLAAQSLVRRSYRMTKETYMTNIMGTVHLYEAVVRSGSVKAVLNVTSDKCYRNQEWLWGYREEDVLGGFDPYSSSKACSELISHSYRQAIFPEHIGLATLRAGNVIGGGDLAKDRLLPDLVRSSMQKIPISIRNPQSVRPWQHVLDPLFGYLQLAKKLYEFPSQFSTAWNFGPSDAHCYSVLEIAQIFVRLWGPSACYQCETNDTLHETTFLKLDSSKAKAILGWSAQFSVEIAMKMTVDWYKKWISRGDNMRVVSLQQIEEYMGVRFGKQLYNVMNKTAYQHGVL